MLVLITGQPGNGKTLYTLGLVEKLRQESGRTVYQSGIPELTLPWDTLDDPAKWFDKPNGSIIVIDECQRVFPPRKVGAAVPDHVREFETHRHRGFDVYLITQHPQLLDIAVRKLTGRHFHIVRTFGREVARVRQWERCVDPQDRSVKNEALETSFPFPKERYQVYKSADIHTVKKQLPWKPILTLVLSVLAFLGLFVFAFQALRSGPAEQFADASADLGVGTKGLDVSSVESWSADSFRPRVDHLPWSAPFYDAHAEVRAVPRITGCLSIRMGDQHICKCSNGQGDAGVPTDICRDYVAGRVFDPLRPTPDSKAENLAYLRAREAGGNRDDGEPGRPPSHSKL